VTLDEQQRIAELLRAGRKRIEIAEELRVSPTTITRWARILGFPDARSARSLVDWAAVQAHYDDGHSIEECRERFGFSYSAWDKAVSRGEIEPRPRKDRGLRTRDQVEALIALGRNQAEIARELGLRKSTVAYHMRKLGRRADPRFARRHDWKAVQDAIDQEGLRRHECMSRFGIPGDAWHRAVQRGDIVPRDWVTPLEDLLVAGRRRNRGHLKARLLQAGLKENRCEVCGLEEWLGRPLSMALHHVNGDGLDNRLENLQILCPNCHAQTDTYGGRNGHRRAKRRCIAQENGG
jgi:5-methylcytosine-specific restriction endonuclease McrA